MSDSDSDSDLEYPTNPPQPTKKRKLHECTSGLASGCTCSLCQGRSSETLKRFKENIEEIDPLVDVSGDVGYNVYYGSPPRPRVGLRPIIIDGSNVAFGHSNGKYFSSKGLEKCIKYFLIRNHVVHAFVPLYRKGSSKTRNPEILNRLANEGTVTFTPSRWLDGVIQAPYDDRYVIQAACMRGGVIVSNDNFRDLMQENPLWEITIKERLLMFTWLGDDIIFPLDPFGRNGPSLKELLRF